MDSNLTKSALLTTSASTDVKRSGGKVSITDLLAFDIDKMLAATQKIYRAEVSQVIGLNVNAITKTANTRYSIKIGNVLNEYEGGQEALKTYAWTSGGSAPSNADLVAGLVAAINNTSISNYVSAVDASPSITITDDAGYYPIRPGGRAGPSTVTLGDNTTGGVITTTTAGVVAYGDGTYIASNVPVFDNMSGNLTSGELDTPTGAVAGQFYDGFIVTYAKEVNHQAVSGLRAEKVLRQLIYVDNGTGASTANLLGYVAFLREFEKLIYHNYTKDSNSIITFIDNTPTFAGPPPTGLPIQAGGSVNVIKFPDGQMDYTVIGTQTILVPNWTTSGLDVVQDAADNDGAEYSASIQAISPVEYVVGQDVCSFKGTYAAGDITDLNPFAHGFRTKIAHNANPFAYADFACIGIDDAAGVTKDIKLKTQLASGGVTTADSTVNWANTTALIFEVQVDINGIVKFLINNIDYSSEIATFTFAAGAILIPSMTYIVEGTADPELEARKWFSIADTFAY